MKVEQEGLPETGTFRLISKRKVEVGQIMGGREKWEER